MTRALGPRPSIWGSHAAAGWMVLVGCWAPFGALWVVWAAARCAAALTDTATTQLTPPEQIVPNPSDIRTVALTVLKVTDTCKEIARRHHAATTDLATLANRTRGQDNRPVIPELNQLYKNLQAAGERTLTELGEAIQHMGPGRPEQAADLALVRQRLTATRALATPRPNAAALADTGFPAPIAKAITPAPTERRDQQSAPPRSAAPKGHSPR
ncbi:hypothetical protein ACQEU3_44720 [Spirillospora sp. CA-253888]